MFKNKVIKKSIGWLVYLSILVGLVWGAPKALSRILQTDYPMASITSGSMWPALKVGDMVLIKGIANKDDIQIGDIVVYRNPLGFTIHRVIQKNANTIVTKGDANNVSDEPVEYSKVIGKTVNLNDGPIRVPYLGDISIFISKFKS